MPPRGDASASLQLGAISLLLVAFTMWSISRRIAVIEESARIDRQRRYELQERLHTREDQLDGALERIKELMPDDPAAGR